MLARTPPARLRRPLKSAGLLLLTLIAGALAGATLGVFVSLLYPAYFVQLVAACATLFGSGLFLYAARDLGSFQKVLEDDAEAEQVKTRARLAKLRKPTWKGMAPRVITASVFAAVAVVLLSLPEPELPHYLAAFVLLRLPGKVIRSVGGRRERIVGAVLLAAPFLILSGVIWLRTQSLPELTPALLVFAAMDVFSEIKALRRDYKLMKTPEYFEIT